MVTGEILLNKSDKIQLVGSGLSVGRNWCKREQKYGGGREGRDEKEKGEGKRNILIPRYHFK